MLTTIIALAAILSTPTERPIGIVGQCDPEGGPGFVWTAEARAEARARVRAACKAQGASKAVCDYLDAVGERESSWRPGVWHTSGAGQNGRGERGLGVLGLSLRWTAHHWPGDDEATAYCQPEASALVALAMAQRAFVAYSATNLVKVQSIYGGRWECFQTDEGRRCFASQTTNRSLCARLRRRGTNCLAPLRREDFGEWVPVEDRAERARELTTRFGERA